MDKNHFQSSLLSWFRKHQRDLPWRHTKDPYKIWLSEIMLQQTQVATVIPYYDRWIKQFPTAESVADAPEEKILKLWEGLGYYSRARNLQAACREVVEKYDGKVPDSLEEIQKLPGIGRYTAGAILSIAFNKPVPLVDGNVIRVLSRLFAMKKNPRKFQVLFWDQAEKLLFKKEPGTFNQALMELGATVCTPANPSCLICPVNSFCLAKKKGIQEQLPLSPKRAKTQIIHLASALIRQNGKILLCQRKETGHLKGMWEPPTIPIQKQNNTRQGLINFLQKSGFEIQIVGNSISLQTSRLHFRLRFQLFQAKLIRENTPSS
ncbi:MAG: A/G-specific adenine glycosylase, partial [Candidatus Omnitrophica bacterium]|nr:A/G-specific adenine glycosylase [Candidatus Omnitrophota bacterium]